MIPAVAAEMIYVPLERPVRLGKSEAVPPGLILTNALGSVTEPVPEWSANLP